MMNNVLVWFWTAVVFSSIAWYGFLLFYVGAKGGYEIVRMTKDLTARPENQRPE